MPSSFDCITISPTPFPPPSLPPSLPFSLRFIANAYDEPCYRLHFRTDAPLDLKVLFFIPSFHGEKFGMSEDRGREGGGEGGQEEKRLDYSRDLCFSSRSP